MSGCVINLNRVSDPHRDDHTPALRDLREEVIDPRVRKVMPGENASSLYPSLSQSRGNEREKRGGKFDVKVLAEVKQGKRMLG